MFVFWILYLFCGILRGVASETAYSDAVDNLKVVVRDGVRDVHFNPKSASISNVIQGVGLAAPLCQPEGYGQRGAPRLLFNGICLDHNTTGKVLLTSNASNAVECASSCEDFHGCKFFEYSNASKSCEALPTTLLLPSNETMCADFSVNSTRDTFALVLPGYPVSFNDYPIVFKCNCHFSGDVIENVDVGGSAVEVEADAAGDFGVRHTGQFFSLFLQISAEQNNASATSFTNTLKTNVGYMTIFQRAGLVAAYVYADGIVEFKYHDDSCVTPEPVMVFPGTENYHNYYSEDLNPFFPQYDVRFEKNGKTLRIEVNGQIRCEREILDSDYFTKISDFSQRGTTDSTETQRVTAVSGSMGWASEGVQTYQVFQPEAAAYICPDQNIIRTVRGLDRNKNDCGARCTTTPLCTHFLYKNKEETLLEVNSDHVGVAVCTLYSGCATHNSSLYTHVNFTAEANGTLYRAYPHGGSHIPQAIFSIRTESDICLSLRDAVAPSLGDVLYGVACDTGGNAMRKWGSMFYFSRSTLRSVYDNNICVGCPGLDQPCTLEVCSGVTTQTFRLDASKNVLRYASGWDACLDITSGGFASMRRCMLRDTGAAAMNQTISCLENEEVQRSYVWSAGSGYLDWVTKGTYTTDNEYISTAHGLAPASLVTSTDATESISIFSPVFCTPVSSVTFKLSGGAPTSGATPGNRGFLGVILRNTHTGAIEKYKALDHFYTTVLQITWTEADLAGINEQRCFQLELFDANPSYLILQDVQIISSGNEGDHCVPITKLRIRQFNPYGQYEPRHYQQAQHTGLKISELLLKELGGGYLTHADVNLYVSSKRNSTVANTVMMDGDFDVARFVELATGGVEEYVEIHVRSPVLIESVQVFLGCDVPGGGPECFSRHNNVLVEVMGGSAQTIAPTVRYSAATPASDNTEPEGTVVRQYRVLSGEFQRFSNATIDFCYKGSSNRTLTTETDELPNCLDGHRDAQKQCSVSSNRKMFHSPYFRVDLGVSHAVSKVVFYPDRASLDWNQEFQIYVGDNPNGPYEAYELAHRNTEKNAFASAYETNANLQFSHSNTLCVNQTFAEHINVERYGLKDVRGNSEKYRFNNESYASSVPLWSSQYTSTRRKILVVDMDCRLSGRYVYIVYPNALDMTLFEVETYAETSSLRPISFFWQDYNKDSLGTNIIEKNAAPNVNYEQKRVGSMKINHYAAEPNVYRAKHVGQLENEGDFSQIACSLIPVSSLTIWGLPCNKKARISLSTTQFPITHSGLGFNDSVTYLNSTQNSKEFRPNSLKFLLGIENGVADAYENSILISPMLQSQRERHTNQQCSAHDSWSLSRVDTKVVFAHNGMNFTVGESHSAEPLYGCLQIHDPDTTVKYQVRKCPENDFICTGVLSEVERAPLFFADKFPNSRFSNVRVKKRNSAAVQDADPAKGGSAVNSFLSYAQTVHRPSLVNITDLNICGNDYLFVFNRHDAQLGIDSLLVEFNTTQPVQVKLFFERPLSLSWLFHEGWSILPEEDTERLSIKIESLKATAMLAVKTFAKGELVQLKGMSQLDVDAVPFIACISRKNNERASDTVNDAQAAVTMVPILFENFDLDMGDCSAPYIYNGDGHKRSASSFEEVYTLPERTVPSVGMHRGRLHSLAAWRAKDGGGSTGTAVDTPLYDHEWYQIQTSFSDAAITLVRGVVIQGYEKHPLHTSEWVTSFMVNYSMNGIDFSSVDNFRSFEGNHEYKNAIVREFHDPILARYIRIIPLTWHKGMALRAGLYLCNTEATPQTSTGFQKNSTGCIIESDGVDRVEGNASLRLRATKSTQHLYGGVHYDRDQTAIYNKHFDTHRGNRIFRNEEPLYPNEDDNACTETYVHNDLPDPFFPDRLSIWGKLSNATLPNAWIFEITGSPRDTPLSTTAANPINAARYGHATRQTVAFRNGRNNAFYAATQRGGGVTDNEWFCLTVFFKKSRSGDIIGLKWFMSGSAPQIGKNGIPVVESGWGHGEVVVDWGRQITKLGLRKKVNTVTTWYDQLEVFSDNTYKDFDLITQQFSYDDAKLINPAENCEAHLAFNSTGDYKHHRLSAQDRPHLLRTACIETCCMLPWCTGVVVPFDRLTNNTSNRGCKLIRKRFFNLTKDMDRDSTYVYADGLQYQFFLKVALVQSPYAERHRHYFHEISEKRMRSVMQAESTPLYIHGAEQNNRVMQTSRDRAKVVHSITLLFSGAYLEMTKTLMRSLIRSSESTSAQPSGFEVYKEEILPDDGIDLSDYPNSAVLHLFSHPNYHITKDEIITLSSANTVLSGGTINTTLFTKGGTLLGWRDVQIVKLRHTAPCDGGISCSGRPCECTTQVCQRAYICGCQHPPLALEVGADPVLHYKGFLVGDTAYLIYDAEYVEYMQRGNSVWFESMRNYLGTSGTVVRLAGGPWDNDDSLLQVEFADGTRYLLSPLSLIKSNGAETCMFHRRPANWLFDNQYPVTLN